MKFTKMFGFGAAMALALMAFASTASATTLEVKGVKQTAAISLKATLKAGTSTLQTDTSGAFTNTCTVSTLEASTSTVTAAGTGSIGGPVSGLSWGTETTPCSEGNPTVDAKGELRFEWIKGTTNATVKLKFAKWTQPSAIGPLLCATPEEGTDLGTMTGVASGNATLDLNAPITCGGITEKWTGTYAITSPEGLGVVE